MAMNDAEFADRLDHFLDALVASADRSPNGLAPPDHELAATVRQVQAHDDAPPADPQFADRLLEDLMHTTTLHDSPTFRLTPALPSVRDRHARTRSVPRLDTSRLGWTLGQLATAALVLLALVGSFIVLGPLRSRSSAWLPILPAISGTPTAEDGVVTETLIDVPDASLPAGPVQIYSGYTELQPGVSASLGGQVGTSFYRVEQGTVKISHSGVEQVVRAGEQMSASMNGEWRLENVGDDLARIVEADVNDALATTSVDASTNSKFSDPQGYADIFVISAATDLTTGSGRVTLERLTLPTGTAMAPFTKTQFDWIGVAAGRVGVTLEGERLPFRWDPGEERAFGLFKSLPTIPPGTEVTLRNAGDEPLVLYRLTIVPSSTGEAPAATPAP
jgi:mannose-6-phosphate isomerase-like protein (cupin superfamily)